jgi:histidine triad (HIT) family protein
MLKVVRWRWIGKIIGWIFEHMSFLIPVNRILETGTLVAFYHPDPSYPVHILLVPKKAIRGVADLGQEDQPFLWELISSVQQIVAQLGLEQHGYRLVVNGGSFQDVPQLHFHLISDLGGSHE